MPDTLNKQSIINLLIDSPLREPIKINLIDIVNNTSEADLPKVYSTITKELEIFQKATERRMKLAEETIAKLSGTPAAAAPEPAPPATSAQPKPAAPQPIETPMPDVQSTTPPPLEVPPLDLPPLPTSPMASAASPAPTPEPTPATTDQAPPAMPTPQPLGAPPVGSSSDEDALAEIQKELDSLKSSTAADIASAGQSSEPAPPAAPAPTA